MRFVVLPWVAFLFAISIGLHAFAGSVDTIPDKIEVVSIALIGNKITHDDIIVRELEFFVGQSYAQSKLDSLMVSSRQNLLNRSLFNFVTITSEFLQGQAQIEVAVVERWYIWPIPIFQFADRNLNAWLQKSDLNRLNYGIDLRVDNFRGRMESLNIIVQTGYDMRFSARWTIPYITRNQVTGMGLGGGIQYNHEIAYQSVDNKPVYYRSSNNFTQRLYTGAVNLTFRPKFNYVHDVALQYYQYHFQDTLLQLNPDFACGTSCRYLQFSYTFKLDFRDYKPYPLSGYYFDIQLRKVGLGLFSEGTDLLWVASSFDQYIPLLKRWFLGYNFSSRLSGDGHRPYFLSTGLGYNDLSVRGYELYVIEGQNYSVFKSNLKFELIPQKDYQIPWIKSEKFSEVFFAMYANLFFDLGYVSDVQNGPTNPLANQLIWGAGMGLDMVSYYDMVVRFEFTINKQKNTGFFINFVAPI